MQGIATRIFRGTSSLLNQAYRKTREVTDTYPKSTKVALAVLTTATVCYMLASSQSSEIPVDKLNPLPKGQGYSFRDLFKKVFGPDDTLPVEFKTEIRPSTSESFFGRLFNPPIFSLDEEGKPYFYQRALAELDPTGYCERYFYHQYVKVYPDFKGANWKVAVCQFPSYQESSTVNGGLFDLHDGIKATFTIENWLKDTAGALKRSSTLEEVNREFQKQEVLGTITIPGQNRVFENWRIGFMCHVLN